MADDQHLALLKQGVVAWNAWRDKNPGIRPDLNEARLRTANLDAANLDAADLSRADLRGANLSKARLGGATLDGADLSRADLRGANLSKASLRMANLAAADLSGASLFGATLWRANLSKANLRGASLVGADLSVANLSGAELTKGYIERAILVDTDLSGADLTGCRVYGVSAWALKLEGTKQQNLVITHENEPTITVDNIEVAQFIYLMLNNQKLRAVIDTVTSKAVLILGRFTDERKAVLDALREELRKREYLPILFDFSVPATRDMTETVSLLARMARFIIADLTDPSSIPKELEAIVPHLAVPVQLLEVRLGASGLQIRGA